MFSLDSCNSLAASEYIGTVLSSSLEARSTLGPLACTLGNPSPDNDSAHELIKMVGRPVRPNSPDRIGPTTSTRLARYSSP
jgi:hypothetical protein